MTICDQARAYVKTYKGRYRLFSDDTGLSYHWVTKFGQGSIKEPGANKIDVILQHKKKAESLIETAA